MNYTWIGDLTNAITGSLTSIGNAIFSFLQSGFTTLFLETSDGATHVSNFGIFLFVMMGISLAFGLTYFIVNMVKHRN